MPSKLAPSRRACLVSSLARFNRFILLSRAEQTRCVIAQGGERGARGARGSASPPARTLCAEISRDSSRYTAISLSAFSLQYQSLPPPPTLEVQARAPIGRRPREWAAPQCPVTSASPWRPVAGRAAPVLPLFVTTWPTLAINICPGGLRGRGGPGGTGAQRRGPPERPAPPSPRASSERARACQLNRGGPDRTAPDPTASLSLSLNSPLFSLALRPSPPRPAPPVVPLPRDLDSRGVLLVRG